MAWLLIHGKRLAVGGSQIRASRLYKRCKGWWNIATKADLRQFLDSGRFFWLDIVGNDAAARGTFLSELGLAGADSTWVQRFGQTGRMTIRRGSLRAVTWLSEGRDNLTEVHLLGSSKFILTLWNGDASALDEARARFSERAKELEKNPYQTAAIVLQLLLGTLDRAASELDLRLQEVQGQLARDATTVDLTTLSGQLRKLRSAWSSIDRYGSAVRSAFVGIAELPEIDPTNGARTFCRTTLRRPHSDRVSRSIGLHWSR